MKQNLKKSMVFGKLFLGLVVLFLLVYGRASTATEDTKVDTETGKGAKQVLFEEYKTNRPKAKAVSIGHPQADQLFSSIAKMYGTTIDISDKYINRVENNKVISIGEAIRSDEGEEAFKKYVAELEGVDREQYDAFMENQVDALSVTVSYLAEAYKLQKSVTNLDVKSLISNPFMAVSAIGSTGLATNQIAYTVKALIWLDKTGKTYKEALESKGR